jgi:hypothetical protein
VVAVRAEDRVLATTVTALLSVSIEPPMVLVSLGATAQVLPYLVPGRSFAVSLLAEGQGRVASVFADAFPVSAPPFAAHGDPVVEDALVQLRCRVDRIDPAGDHLLVLALVETAVVGSGGPLIRYERGYRRLADR